MKAEAEQEMQPPDLPGKSISIDSICLKVFAGIAATVTHEIKNSLSVINESAGLLDDLAAMAEDDGGVPAMRVRAAATALMKQVARSNTIMTNLNRFAHSGDIPISTANLLETLSLLVELTSRLAAGKRIDVTVKCSTDIQIQTYLLALEALLYRTLCYMYAFAPEGSTVSVEAIEEGNKINIIVCLFGRVKLLPGEYPEEEDLLIASQLHGRVQNRGEQLIVSLPRVMK